MLHSSNSYDPSAYETLPGLSNAARELATQAGQEAIRGAVRAVFMHHGVFHEYGIQLLHKHFDMDPSEKLVEYGYTQSPWPAASADRVVGGYILPKSWRFWGNGLCPYEFRFVSKVEGARPQTPTFSSSFVEDLRTLLDQLKLTNLLGITLIDYKQDGSDPELMEVTYGRNSCMVPFVKDDVGRETYTATWSFAEIPSERAVTEAVASGTVIRHNTCHALPGTTICHNTCHALPGTAIRHNTCHALPGTATGHNTCDAKASA